jgi:O-antigen/teichoic acid export membrane protein
MSPRKEERFVDHYWHPKKRSIVAIWAVVIAAAVVLAIIFQDDDPNTDEGAGAGALAFVVGMVATTIYLAVGSYRHSRRRKRTSKTR